MNYYSITFRWYETNTYCSNIVIASNEETARKHYEDEGKEVVGISPASEYDLQDAQRKGKPIITIEDAPEEEKTESPKGYEILTKNTCYSIGESDEEKEALVNEQNEVLESLGYDLSAAYDAHFFESGFFDDLTTYDDISSLIERLAIKDGVDLVRFENGNIGFVAYYSGKENGFEILGSVTEKREALREYLEHLEADFPHDLVMLWASCCEICDFLDKDEINIDIMIDIILDYNDSLNDTEIDNILNYKG